MRRLIPVLSAYLASSGSLAAASAAQLVTFAMLARSLGPIEFGLFVQFTAITSIAIQLCGLGASDCLVRRVSRDAGSYREMLGHNLLLTVGSGSFLVVLGLAVLPFWLAVSPDPLVNGSAIALLLVTNIVVVRGILLAESIFLGHTRFADANRAVVGYAVARTAIAAVACYGLGTTTLAQWALWQFLGNAVVLLVYVWWLRGLGRPRFVIVTEEVRLGILFASQFAARALRQNADLFVLGLVAPIAVVGSYGVARRILDSSYLAIDAMNRLIYATFARTSMTGLHEAMPSARRAVVAAFALGCVTAAILFLAAPYLPLIFGREYESLTYFVRALSGVIILVAIWSVAIDLLGASGHQGARAAVINGISLLGAGLVAWATWIAPPQGTILAFYAIEGCTVVAAWFVLVALARRSRAVADRDFASDDRLGPA